MLGLARRVGSSGSLWSPPFLVASAPVGTPSGPLPRRVGLPSVSASGASPPGSSRRGRPSLRRGSLKRQKNKRQKTKDKDKRQRQRQKNVRDPSLRHTVLIIMKVRRDPNAWRTGGGRRGDALGGLPRRVGGQKDRPLVASGPRRPPVR